MTTSLPGVVVGVDGSPGSIEAARWAAGDATSQYLPLTIAYVVPDAVGAGGAPEQLVERVAEDVHRHHRGLDVRTLVLTGVPGDELIELAAYAALLVVGARGRDGFPALLLGSVSDRVATHGSCPTVVVRGRSTAFRAPVVVGDDGSARSYAALEHAFATADRLRAPLSVVRTYPVALATPMLGIAHAFAEPDLELATREDLAETVAPLAEKYPDVEVRLDVAAGPAAAQLVEASRHARLVVVGTHGRGSFTSLLLGSVSRQVLHHAGCPVAVVR